MCVVSIAERKTPFFDGHSRKHPTSLLLRVPHSAPRRTKTLSPPIEALQPSCLYGLNSDIAELMWFLAFYSRQLNLLLLQEQMSNIPISENLFVWNTWFILFIVP
jgi:hypothetical protein